MRIWTAIERKALGATLALGGVLLAGVGLAHQHKGPHPHAPGTPPHEEDPAQPKDH